MKAPVPQITIRSRARFCAGAILLFSAALLVAVGGSLSCGGSEQGQGKVGQEVQSPQPGAAARPVILLTGFEPFGPGRPANPSWEGIKPLDGRPWKECQLVCKEMKVVWGQPLEQLQRWIAEYHPVAIFSFGQGGTGSFAVESRASNRRGNIADNKDAPPPRPTIVEDGPDELRATADCEQLARSLSRKGYHIRVSTRAGRYLCEETLYTLEYLKSKGGLESVLFCHVPPLGTQVEGKPVTVEYVREFVEDLLEAWHAARSQKAPASSSRKTSAEQPADPRHAEVEELIKRYFATWSNQDIDGYGQCFMGNATIQFIDSQEELTRFSLAPFLASQREAQRMAQYRQTEVPETTDIRFEGPLARVVVYWKLTAGPMAEYGYDHFTLMKYKGQWRIVNLVFYATKRSG